MRRETITVFDMDSELDCELDSEKQELVDSVVNEYGEMTRENMDKVIQGTQIYAETKLGNVLDFSKIR
jgi:hypothetical protein